MPFLSAEANEGAVDLGRRVETTLEADLKVVSCFLFFRYVIFLFKLKIILPTNKTIVACITAV